MTASSTSTGGTWSDANILALLDEANVADSSEGAIAATKGTSAAVVASILALPLYRP